MGKTKIKYDFQCSMCGKLHEVEIEVSDEDAAKISFGEMSLKDATAPGTFDREIFISGMCYDCQEKVFNRPAPGHEEEWGLPSGECPVCGSPLYKRDIDADFCPQCKCCISEEESE